MYTSYEFNAINKVTTNTGTHTFHITDVPLNKHTCHIAYVCPTTLLLLSTYRLQPVGLELSSNMYMYYAFGKHTYSIYSMTTYVFLAWQTHISVFIPVTLESVHMYV